MDLQSSLSSSWCARKLVEEVQHRFDIGKGDIRFTWKSIHKVLKRFQNLLNCPQNLYVLPCRYTMPTFFCQSTELESAASCSRTLSIICCLDPQRVDNSVMSWWAGRPSWIYMSANSLGFFQLWEKLLTICLHRVIAQVMRLSSMPCPGMQSGRI